MFLSDLQTGQDAIIIKVNGHGGFRKRIIEMGFIKGQNVTALLNAPLKDPVKYRVMGYEVSLRHSEARMIEVMTPEEARRLREKARKEGQNVTGTVVIDSADSDEQPLSSKELHDEAEKQSRRIKVALVGNPNCGKTSLFNFASGSHERVGNYSGVTVDAKEGHASMGGYDFAITDLPGTYSISAYSIEERYVKRQLIDETPDVVINVIDTSNLERNLYLTTQLIDMHVRMVVALNMFDETTRRGDNIDLNRLSELFGVPMVPTVFTTGKGVKELFDKVIEVYETAEDKEPHFRHIHIDHGHEIENGIKEIQEHLKQEQDLRQRFSTRYLAIKLLEGDRDAEELVNKLPDSAEIMAHRDEAAKRVKEETKEDCETAIMDAKYGFIHGALMEANYKVGDNNDNYRKTHALDAVLTNKYMGFPIFLLILAVMFITTFVVGQYPMDWIDALMGWFGDIVSRLLPDGPVKAMFVDGVIGGVGSVIVFLPQILILYFFISFMEDCGYMARAAFVMDKLMHMIGLHGKSFIPLIMGFGCNVPAVMSTRTIESRRSRLVTMLIIPLMSCEARIPIYIMIIGTFFAVKYQWAVMMSLYLIGMIMAALLSKVFTRFVFKGEDTPFVMELPPYRFPTAKAISRHTWEKGKQYLKKMGGIILVATIIVWALGYFPHDEKLSQPEQQEQSYIGQIGHAVEPVFRPQGFNWKLDVGLLAGVGAKEIVASTMGVLYTDDDSFADDNSVSSDTGKYARLHKQMEKDGVTPLIAYCFLLFVLLYFPCVATIAAIKGETGSWKWAGFAAAYTTCLAWIVSALVYQIGSLF